MPGTAAPDRSRHVPVENKVSPSDTVKPWLTMSFVNPDIELAAFQFLVEFRRLAVDGHHSLSRRSGLEEFNLLNSSWQDVAPPQMGPKSNQLSHGVQQCRVSEQTGLRATRKVNRLIGYDQIATEDSIPIQPQLRHYLQAGAVKQILMRIDFI